MLEVYVGILVGATDLKRKSQAFYLNDKYEFPAIKLMENEEPYNIASKLLNVYFGVNLDRETPYNYGITLNLLDAFAHDESLYLMYWCLLPEVNNPGDLYEWKQVSYVLSEYNLNEFTKRIVRKFGKKI